MKIEFYHQFKKTTKIKFHENPSSESRIVPHGRADVLMDRHVEVNSHFSQFCKCAYWWEIRIVPLPVWHF